MDLDGDFKSFFDGKLAQVFLYITDKCNIDCVQCLYKPDRTFSFGRGFIPLEVGNKLLRQFYELGARKLTLLGGEPTLHPRFFEFASCAKDLGYEYIRIDTNGQFGSNLIRQNKFEMFDEITFSLDGHIPEVNDEVRGKGTFAKCLARIDQAVESGIKVQITSCIHRGLLELGESGRHKLTDMIDFFLSKGVDKCNFHSLVKTGVARDTWSGDIHLGVEEYLWAYELVDRYRNDLEQNGDRVRIPKGFIDLETFVKERSYYGYCSAKQADRVLVFPNQMIRLCSLMIGTPYCVGYYDENSIYMNNSPTNELSCHDMSSITPCTNQCKAKGRIQGKVPLCVSFKPNQVEYAWNNLVNWGR